MCGTVLGTAVTVLTAMTGKVLFWDVMACTLIGRYQRFGGTDCLHIQGGKVKQQFYPENGICRFLRIVGNDFNAAHHVRQ